MQSTALPAAGTRALRVATLCAMDQGGAAIGSHRRIEALRACGVDATLHVLTARSRLPHVRRVASLAPGVPAEAVWPAVVQKLVAPAERQAGFRAREMFSLPGSVVDFRDLRPVFDAADVVHLHWVTGMLDLEHLDVLADKPVVWTLADMNPFTGGCHYSEGCDGYRRGCQACPLLGGETDLAHESWRIKRAAYRRLKRLHVVCPSQWMADRVKSSTLLGDRPVHVIPNAFPTDRLVPTNPTVARIRLGLPLRKKLLLFGAHSLVNRRKGGAWLVKAIETLARRGADDVEVVLFGSGRIELPLPVHSLGPVHDVSRMALAYSAADAFVFPSLEDNAPLTVGESLLCGTPVVAFPVGNVPELVRHRETGWIAHPEDADDLVRGLDWALGADAATAMRRAARCRSSAAAVHDPRLAAERHLQVYRAAMQAGDGT